MPPAIVGGMRFLSFSQPWLWSITDLPEPFAKRIENRKWTPPISEIGRRFALHAAESWDAKGTSYFVKLGVNAPGRFDMYARGQIVGVATISRVVSTDATLLETQRRWFFGPYGWLLEDVHNLPSPIVMKGAQGFRWLPLAIEREINEQLATINVAPQTGGVP